MPLPDRAPRARGDGPGATPTAWSQPRCSPRTRGWSLDQDGLRGYDSVLPAHAGMVLNTLGFDGLDKSAPRARGDGPTILATCQGNTRCSPRTRGWSPFPVGRHQYLTVLPAHAGMVPGKPRCLGVRGRAPRARGDGPLHGGVDAPPTRCSPRTRGWSQPSQPGAHHGQVLPAHAGMVPAPPPALHDVPGAPRARGDGPHGHPRNGPPRTCSPRTRGWSLPSVPGRLSGQVLPAHAGMVPSDRGNPTRPVSAPRARGDGPQGRATESLSLRCSPRTRGWSPALGPVHGLEHVLPAHAGMVPPWPPRHPARAGAPRARGDGPHRLGMSASADRCSPRTRGWSRHVPQAAVLAQVLPAHAGMVPRPPSTKPPARCAPRARGDGPTVSSVVSDSTGCSPRTRGWSPGCSRSRSP